MEHKSQYRHNGSITRHTTLSSYASHDDCYDTGLTEKSLADACAYFAAERIVRYSKLVIVAWIGIVIVSAFIAPWLLQACKSVYTPLPSMPSGQSKVAFDRHYPEVMGKSVDSVLFTLHEDKPGRDGIRKVEEAANALDYVLTAVNSTHPDLIEEARSWRRGQGAGEFGTSYISKDNRSYLLEVHWRSPKAGRIREQSLAVEEFLASVSNLNKTYSPLGIDMVVAGEHAVSAAVKEMAEEDIGMHAVMFLPVAIGATHTQLCRWQLLLLPAICCIVSLVGAFALGYFTAEITTVGSTVPTLMAFLCIALVIDWSFFLLARFREETLKRVGHEVAIVRALVNTGSTIALSGFMIFLCSSCMALMPPAIASNALGGCLVVVVGLSVCLTLLPALLAAMPACFAGVTSDCGCGADDEDLELDVEDDEHSAALRAQRMEEKVQRSLWYRWAKLVTRYPCNLVLMVSLCVVYTPCTLRLLAYTPAVDDKMATPPHAAAVIAGKRLEEGFAGKDLGKSNMLVLVEGDASCETGVRNNDYFTTLCELAQKLVTLRHGGKQLRPEHFLGVGFYGMPGEANVTCLPWHREATKTWAEWWYKFRHNQTIDGNILLTGKTNLKTDEFIHFHHLYAQLWQRVVSKDDRASVILMRLPWSAMNTEGFELVRDLRKALNEFRPSVIGSCRQVRVSELSVPSVWLDYVEASISSLPKALLLACAITTPFIGVSFWSCVAPLKLLLTVVLPMTWIYGTAILCFQDGIFDFLGDSPVHSNGGLHWSVPCMTAILLLALALDYNIFYFGRVYEYRKDGWSDLEAIRRGLVSTGPIITTAGCIFAVEFTGMFFSATELNKQGGFIIVTGVLFDTFVIRSIMMPATLSLYAEFNWWPYRMPAAVKTNSEDFYMGSRANSLASRAESLASVDEDG